MFGDRGPMRGGFYPGRFADYGGGHDALLWAIFALELALLTMFVLVLVARLAGGRRHRGGSWGSGPGRHVWRAGRADPLAVLRFRYARGELTREEFLRATEDLGGGAPAVEEPPAPPAPPPSA